MRFPKRKKKAGSECELLPIRPPYDEAFNQPMKNKSLPFWNKMDTDK